MKEKHRNDDKVRIAISIGDVNGIGIEVILKTMMDNRVYDHCIPVVYGSAKALSYHRKALGIETFMHHNVTTTGDFKNKTLNVVNCLGDDIIINLGQASELSGRYALEALDAALKDLKNGIIDALVTAPLNKSTVKPKNFEFKGHTEYITQYFGVEESLMMLVSDAMKVGLVTNHVPVHDIAVEVNAKKILSKLKLMNDSLIRDFSILKPKIALLGLNPHAGDNGLIGNEEKEIIVPAMEKARENDILVFGPFPADGFFASRKYASFDAVLAMYHDQGLIPFKTIAFEDGVNFTAGLPIVRTSPDHGTAYDLAGKNQASEASFRKALFAAVDIFRSRRQYDDDRQNPLKRTVMAREMG